MNKTTTLEAYLNAFDHEELGMLVHGYDHHLIDCERTGAQPLSLMEYAQSNTHQDLVDSGEIYDVMEYESELEEATLDEMKQLALIFNERVQQAIQTGATFYPKLDLLIDELEVGISLTDEEKTRTEQFHKALLQYGYVPTTDGSLVHATEVAKETFNPNSDFVWDDYKLAHEVIQRHEGQVHVCTMIDAGRYLLATGGWRYANRLGYFLSSQPLVDIYEEVVL